MNAERAPSVAAVILGGGRSSRMGRDKASLTLRGRSLMEWTLDSAERVPGLIEVVVVLADGQDLPFRTSLPATVIHDEQPYAGPLVAIGSGLRAVTADVALVLGCDTPFVQPSLLALLVEHARDHAIVVPVHDGRPQPLCSAIRRDAMPSIAALIAEGVRAASAIADDPRARLLEPADWAKVDPEALSFVGVNTPDELRQAEVLAARLDARATAGAQHR